MRIHGVLSWYRESPAWLAATVASFGKLCDTLTAVDGRYALYPGEWGKSPIAEAEAILEVTEGLDLPLTLHRPTEPFHGNEVEKRNLLLRLMLANATPHDDWLMILDGDEYITRVSVDLRERLEQTERHAVEYALEEYIDPDRADAPLAISRMRNLPTVSRSNLRAMYRVLPDIAYHGTHHTIGGTGPDGEFVWLWGHPQMCEALNLTQDLVVRHRNVLRTKERRSEAATYYADRDRLGIESAPWEDLVSR